MEEPQIGSPLSTPFLQLDLFANSVFYTFSVNLPLKSVFIYLKNREEGREGKIWLVFHPLISLPRSLQWPGLGLSQEPGTQSETHTGEAATAVPELSPAASRGAHY